MKSHVSHEVNVTPKFIGITPTFEASIYETREAGICQRIFSSGNLVIMADVDLIELDRWIASKGFVRTGLFGKVCDNGFATASIVRLSS